MPTPRDFAPWAGRLNDALPMPRIRLDDMALASPLAEAIHDRFLLERELGRGGMATVYLARDLKHDRLVALKVLRSDLAALLGPDRFLQEIRFTARLQHPHILPVFDSGEAEGQLWYTMPYVDGASLRDRLRQEGQLSVSEAVRIAREVAEALDHSHRHGVIHRDIKPENILLEEGHAAVADFGIARAVSRAAGATPASTEAGVVLGSPAYMSPEQAMGETTVDGRTDVYALGCVLYEMLAGAPPLMGPTAQAVLARRVSEPVPHISALCEAVSPQLDAVIARSLACLPADRFTTAAEFARALESAELATRGPEGPSRSTRSSASFMDAPETARPRRRILRWGGWLVGLSVAGLGLAAAVGALRSRAQAVKPDPNVVAVLPFRVSGADSSLGYLREGMVDLLATKLAGTRGMRTVDPRTLLHAWRQAGGSLGSDIDRAGSVAVVRSLGAGRWLEGEVIGTPHRLILNARLSETGSGEETRVSLDGPADSLTSLVDRLAAQLLAVTAGEGQERLGALTTTSLPALRAYLDGHAAHRRGDYATARDLFDRALAHDSSFALAGLARARTAMWLSGDIGGTQVAWRHRDRLPRRDLLLLQVMLGQRYPLLGDAREDLNSAEALVAAAPDDPEAWDALADRTFHYGALAGLTDARERSIRAYERALALDSSYAPSLEHLYELYYAAGDPNASRQALALRLRGEPNNAEPAARWFARAFLGDTVLGTISVSDDSLVARTWDVVVLALRYAGGLAEAESLLSLRRSRVATDGERKALQELAWTFFVIRGKPTAARTWLTDRAGPVDRAEIILGALYADADSSDAAQVVRSIPRIYERPAATSTWPAIVERYGAAQYDLAQGRRNAAEDAVRAWGGVWTPQDTSQAVQLASHFALLLDTQLAALEHRSDALVRLAQLDSLLQTAPSYGGYVPTALTFGGFEPIANLIAARLWHEQGGSNRALAAIRRRLEGFLAPVVYSTQLRDEARYAAFVGDREGAGRAYRQYLALRSDAEPPVQARVRAVRAELDALEGEPAAR